MIRELELKIGHVSGETSTLRFSPLTEDVANATKAKIIALNSGHIDYNGTREVNYQEFLLSKNGSPATTIQEAALTQTESTRIYTRTA